MPKTAPTSSEVARRAGVSRTTVSFVLNDVRDKGISDGTRARVLAAAREMNYEPNAAARSLARGLTGTVALVIPKASHLCVDAFLAQLAASINDECHRHDLRMLIESTDDDGRDPGSFVNLVRGRHIDGLIVANLRTSANEHLNRVADAGIPLVVLSGGAPGLERFCTLSGDTSLPATTLVKHMIGLGHERIAYISFALPEYYSVSEREQGWRAALNASNIDVDPAWLEYADITAQSGYEAARRLIARGAKFSALFAGNDTIAFGAMKALTEAGMRIPRDVAVVGYDDIPLAAFAAPPLTTMRSDPSGDGKKAMQLLLSQLGGEVVPQGPRQLGQPRLVVRDSCGARLRMQTEAQAASSC